MLSVVKTAWNAVSVFMAGRIMKIEQQYQALQKLKPEINEKLKELNFQKIKELILWLAKSEDYLRLKRKDDQLRRLDIFCNIWLEEKKVLPELGIVEDIFSGVRSLRDIEEKYQLIRFGVMRLETVMPEEYYEQVVERFIKYKVSGIAIAKIIYIETQEQEKNVLKIVQLLRERGQMITAMTLLESAEKNMPGNKRYLSELADCWLSGQQWEQALGCLKKIEKPDPEIQGLIRELEKNVSHAGL